MIRNDGQHTITDAIWIWTGIKEDGQRIPMSARLAVGGKPGDFLVAAPSFPLTQLLMQRAKQPGAQVSGLQAMATEVQSILARYTTVEASLDVVVLNNEMAVGPDHFGLIE